MGTLLVTSALRSSALAAVVWLTLRLLRIRDPHRQLAAYTLLLAAMLLMPAVTQLMNAALPTPSIDLPTIEYAPADITGAFDSASTTANLSATIETMTTPRPTISHLRWDTAIFSTYAVVGGTLLLRLAIGLLLASRLVRRALRLREGWTKEYDVRASGAIDAPATFGTVILLPMDHTNWSAARRSAVLLHEAAHVRRHDFFVQIIASLNCAVFWFNPLSWWLRHGLLILAEAASDEDAIAGLGDRLGYAEILLEVSSRGRMPAGAVAMARTGTIPRRIERILAQPQAKPIAQRARLILVASLLPLAAAAAGPVSFVSTSESQDTAALPIPHRRIFIDPKLLEADVGFYKDVRSESVMAVTRDGDHLVVGGTAPIRVADYPFTDQDFFRTVSSEEDRFVTDADGEVRQVLHEKNGLTVVFERISADIAHQLETEYDQRIAQQLAPHTVIGIDSRTLDRFVGTYQLTPNYMLTVTREDGQLFVQGTDRGRFPVFPYNQQDFFFTSAAAQITFIGPKDAMVDTLVFHQNGQDRTAVRVNTVTIRQFEQRLADEQKPHTAIHIDSGRFAQFVGRYGNSAFTMTITRSGDQLWAQVAGYSPYRVYPYTDHDFFAASFPAQISFVENPQGEAPQLVRHEHGEDITLNRLGSPDHD